MTDTSDVPRTLLLADGNQTTQRVVALAFAAEPFSVATASDGDDVVAALEQSVPDVVLADIGLSGMNGYDVAEHMHRDDRLAQVPVLLLAGAFDTVDRDRVAAAGVTDVITKPFDPQKLVERVQQAVAGRTRATSPRVERPAAVPVELPKVDEPVVRLTKVAEPVVRTPKVEEPVVRTPKVDEPVVGAPKVAEPVVRLEAPVEPDIRKAPAPEVPVPSPGQRPPQRDRYFEQLDEAFAALSQRPQPEPSGQHELELELEPEHAMPSAPPAPPVAAARPAAAPVAAAPSAPAPVGPSPVSPVPARPVPVAPAPVSPVLVTPAPASPAPISPVPATPVQVASVPVVAAPPQGAPQQIDALGDVFAALLAAEETGEPPASVLPALALDETASVAAGVPSRRAIEQMTDRVVRETVSAIVASTAERLVREEIERIKRHIK